MSNNNHGRYVVLDGMRGIAAIAVMVFHYTSHYPCAIFENAPCAVDMFFMLSGFVLCFSYGEKIAQGQIGFGNFMLRRLIRLYPIFLVGLLLGTAGLLLSHKFGYSSYLPRETIASAGYNAFFIPYINNGTNRLFERPFDSIGTIFPSNGAAWSLFFELFANLFFIRLLLQSAKTTWLILVCSLLALLLFGVFNAFSHYQYNISLDGGWSSDTMAIGFPRVFFGFTVGILLQKMVSEKISSRLLQKGISKKCLAFFSTRALLIYFLLFAVFLIPADFTSVVMPISIIFICPALVLIGAYTTLQNTFVLKLSRFLGWISYPLYCLHAPIGNLIAIANNEGGLAALIPLPFAVSASLATLLASIVLTKFYEEPLRFYLTAKAKNLQKLNQS